MLMGFFDSVLMLKTRSSDMNNIVNNSPKSWLYIYYNESLDLGGNDKEHSELGCSCDNISFSTLVRS